MAIREYAKLYMHNYKASISLIGYVIVQSIIKKDMQTRDKLHILYLRNTCGD